jgi:DNA modification methylase
MNDILNTIRRVDCVEAMNQLPPGSVDLVFADPPFNIGYTYDVYDDSVDRQQYIDWSAKWLASAHRVLKRNGTFWLAIGDDYAAELKIASQKVGFHCRSWVIWYYTFGVNCARKFTRSHTHLLYFVKDAKDFTFRDEDLDNRIPSARELVYDDNRANPKGRLPDDTWIIRPAGAVGEFVSDAEDSWAPPLVAPPADTDRTFTLRPQDIGQCFSPAEDTWYFPRVAGTFRERAGFHGCQMPEQLLGRIIRTCSNPGDIVLDPFSGSATTLAVAKKLGRRFIGFDISEQYVRYGRERLNAIRVGDRLDGSPEPLKSAPRAVGNAKKGRPRRPELAAFLPDDLLLREKQHAKTQSEMTERGIIEAFERTHNGFSMDRIVADPDLNKEFVMACTNLGLAGDARTWNMLLFRLRKAGRLSHIETLRRTSIPWDECDEFLFASEIAWQMLLDDHSARSLDEILCDPELAAQFDEIAGRFAPGHKPLDYRWGALKLRKEARYARSRAMILKPPDRFFGKMLPIDELGAKNLPEKPGLFVLSEDENRTRNLYAGETLNLRRRFTCRRTKAWWRNEPFPNSIFVKTLAMDWSTAGKLAWQSCLVRQFEPRLNCFELRSAS